MNRPWFYLCCAFLLPVSGCTLQTEDEEPSFAEALDIHVDTTDELRGTFAIGSDAITFEVIYAGMNLSSQTRGYDLRILDPSGAAFLVQRWGDGYAEPTWYSDLVAQREEQDFDYQSRIKGIALARVLAEELEEPTEEELFTPRGTLAIILANYLDELPSEDVIAERRRPTDIEREEYGESATESELVPKSSLPLFEICPEWEWINNWVADDEDASIFQGTDEEDGHWECAVPWEWVAEPQMCIRWGCILGYGCICIGYGPVPRTYRHEMSLSTNYVGLSPDYAQHSETGVRVFNNLDQLVYWMYNCNHDCHTYLTRRHGRMYDYLGLEGYEESYRVRNFTGPDRGPDIADGPGCATAVSAVPYTTAPWVDSHNCHDDSFLTFHTIQDDFYTWDYSDIGTCNDGVSKWAGTTVGRFGYWYLHTDQSYHTDPRRPWEDPVYY